MAATKGKVKGVRLDPREIAATERAAREAGVTWSEWARRVLCTAAGTYPSEHSPGPRPGRGSESPKESV